MAARHVRARSKVLACLAGAALLLAASAGSASGTASPGHLEVDVMNEPVRGGEPEIAINPGNPNNLVLGHTVVGNSYTNISAAAGMTAVNGGLQVSNDGGKTWTADRALHTSGYSEGPNPYLIAHGQPTATGFTLTTNGVGDPIEASGPDGSIYAGGVLAHTTPTGPPPFGFSVPQGRDRGGPVDECRSDIRSDQRRLERPGRARDGQSRDDPETELDRSGSSRSTVLGWPSTSRPVRSTFRQQDIRNATSPCPTTMVERGGGSRRSTVTK